MMAAVLDHLWQSTLMALAAALLTIPLRRASAAVRYGVWFTASVKFLIPFAALAALGRLLAPALRSPSRAAPEAVFIERAAAPLARFPFSPQSPLAQVHAATPAAHAAQAAAPHIDLTLALLAVWALGSAVILVAWLARWVRVRRIVRAATPLGWSAPMPVLASSSLMEPGLIGLWRPILVIPESLPEHLGQPEIDAILAHEACHLRRRDNLFAAVHMLAEALFWFHPLVWWIGARLIAERERACDEAVVEAGHDRAAYARSLVESCRLYLQSPLDCVAGAAGSNLKTRVQAIMTAPAALPLSRAKKALLLAAGACALATPVAAGLLTSPEGQKVVARAKAAAIASAPALLAAPTIADPTPETAAPLMVAQAAAAPPPAPSAAASTPEPLPALAADIAARRAEQERPRQVVPFDPAHFDAYVGFYQLGPNAVFKISRDGDKLLTQLTGQGPVRVYPESETSFFATVVAAQISFVAGADGQASELILHQGGLDQNAKRISPPVAAAIEGAITQRIASQKPSPGTEDSVRRWLASLEAGQPNYDDMAPGLARAAREQWPMTSQVFRAFGPLKDVRFVRVTPQGLDLYEADFAHAKIQVVMAPLTADGKAAGRSWQPIWTENGQGQPGRLPPLPSGGAPAPAPQAVHSAPTSAPAPAIEPADAAKQAASFVEAYAATDNAVIARWDSALCVRVVGLAPDQAAAVKARVEQVARTVGVETANGCQRSNIEIGFTTDPQGMLNGVIKGNSRLLGDRTSGTQDSKAVTLPVQAWYRTNEGNYAANGTGGLKALVSMQYNGQNEAGYAQWMGGQGAPNNAGGGWGGGTGWGSASPSSGGVVFQGPRQFLNVFVIVDVRRIGDRPLGPVTDYVAMVALSQPRSLDHCNVLPSVTDLFAGACPGHAPEGLTAADAAYLSALYATGSPAVQPAYHPRPPLKGTKQQASVVERMAKILATTKMAAN